MAFKVDRRITDEELLAALTAAFTPVGIRVKLIQFDGRMGIFRCRPHEKEKALAALASRSSEPFELVTLSTSGTLRTLREKYFPTAEGGQ